MSKGVSEAKIKEMLRPGFGVDKLWEELDKLTEVVNKMSDAVIELQKYNPTGRLGGGGGIMPDQRGMDKIGKK